MSFYSISQLKESVSSILSGIDLNNVSDLYGAFEAADRTLVQQADIPEASGIQNITLYAGVIDYPCDTKIFGTAINDIRPQGVSRWPGDFVFKMFADDFDRNKIWGLQNSTMATFQYNKGTPLIRIVSTYVRQEIILDPMTALNNWTAGGGASGLALDSTVFYQAPASLRFNLGASASPGYISETLQSSLDLNGYQGVGVIFLAVEVPDGDAITSFTVRIGTDSSNYYEVTNTEGFLGAFPSGEWFLVDFDLAGATTVGSPNISNINYLDVITNYNGTAQNNVRMGGLWISLPNLFQILFQSPAIFLSTQGTVSSTITGVDDQIILNEAAYNIYLYECAEEVLRRTGGALADSRMGDLHDKLHGRRARNGTTVEPGLYDIYRGDNPSQELRTAGNWYQGQNYRTRPYT